MKTSLNSLIIISNIIYNQCHINFPLNSQLLTCLLILLPSETFLNKIDYHNATYNEGSNLDSYHVIQSLFSININPYLEDGMPQFIINYLFFDLTIS